MRDRRHHLRAQLIVGHQRVVVHGKEQAYHVVACVRAALLRVGTVPQLVRDPVAHVVARTPDQRVVMGQLAGLAQRRRVQVEAMCVRLVMRAAGLLVARVGHPVRG